jgi:hypothetical protein
MRAVESRIDIAAPPWRVWRVLTDFDTYSVWNPVLTRVRGCPEEGARLRVRVEPPGRRSALTLNGLVVALETGREVRWRSRLLLLPGLLDGEHAFHLEWLAGGRATRLRQAARFTGLLAPFAGTGDRLETAKRGLEAMDAALKTVAEQPGVAAMHPTPEWRA